MAIKIIRRVCASVMILGFAVLAVPDIANYLIHENPAAGIPVLGIFFLCILFIWIYAFYHWGMTKYSKKWYKTLWFFIILFGLYVGAFFYYIFVIELRLGLANEVSMSSENKGGG
jgi:hypothetical protein